jgi:hypothetical protein
LYPFLKLQAIGVWLLALNSAYLYNGLNFVLPARGKSTMIQGDTPQKAVIDYRVNSGAGQFYWIAGLGVASSILYAVNTSIYFPLGLAVTQLLTDSSHGLPLEMRVAAALSALAFLGVFVLSGYFARKGELRAFILGGSVYLFDAVLFIILGDWYAVAVHVFFLYYIVRGILFLKETGEG